MKASFLSLLALTLAVLGGCLPLPLDENAGTPDPKDQPGDRIAAMTGRVYFDTEVTRAFKEITCRNCHKFVFEGGSAPLSIFIYDSMKAKLQEGGSPLANSLYAYARGTNGHANYSDLCYGSPNSSPCQEIAIWYQKEFGNGTGTGLPPLGRMDPASASGLVSGWSQDLDEPEEAVQIEIYADGARGVGELVATVPADQMYSGAGPAGKVRFSFQMPDRFRDKMPHTIQAYAVDTQDPSQVVELKDSPQTRTWYIATGNGRSHYDSTVMAFITANNNARCGRCHSSSEFAYDRVLYNLFLDPAPPAGGAANNRMYNRMRGLSHPGGNFCGGSPSTTAPCSDLIQVWNLEFQ
jgi:hypothetical protein